MTDYECILLAGIPNAPSVYAPTKNLELAKQRQRQVMKKMIEYGYLTESEANNILNENNVRNILIFCTRIRKTNYKLLRWLQDFGIVNKLYFKSVERNLYFFCIIIIIR